MMRSKGVARLQRGKVDRSSAEGALVETPKAPRGVRCGEGCSLPQGVSPSPPGEGSAGGLDRLPRIFFII